MTSLCIYCGSRHGKLANLIDEAKKIGKLLAKKDITLVYGGANVGLMGTFADSCLDDGGRVVGVLPQALQDREVSHENLTELHVVENMHIRKQKMVDLSDAFLIFPGGIGTLDEFVEIFTWYHLEFHNKPIALFNIDGFYDPLLKLLDHVVDNGFLPKEKLKGITVLNKFEDIESTLLPMIGK